MAVTIGVDTSTYPESINLKDSDIQVKYKSDELGAFETEPQYPFYCEKLGEKAFDSRNDQYGKAKRKPT